jgi:two-component system OmpR family response regulator
MADAFVDRQTVLVADDEEDVRFLLSRLLGDVGYEVHLAQDGLEALERIDASRPDLMILDLMMPGLDGWGVLKRLESHPNPPLVVLLTARGDPESFARGIRAGAAAYVTKPFRFHELIATVQGLLASVGNSRPMHSERRREPRRPHAADVRVYGRDDTPLALGHCVDLSRGGVKVHLGMKLNQGFPVSVAFDAVRDTPAARIDGLVAWSQPVAQGYAHGLSFVTLTPETARKVEALLGVE